MGGGLSREDRAGKWKKRERVRKRRREKITLTKEDEKLVRERVRRKRSEGVIPERGEKSDLPPSPRLCPSHCKALSQCVSRGVEWNYESECPVLSCPDF